MKCSTRQFTNPMPVVSAAIVHIFRRRSPSFIRRIKDYSFSSPSLVRCSLFVHVLFVLFLNKPFAYSECLCLSLLPLSRLLADFLYDKLIILSYRLQSNDTQASRTARAIELPIGIAIQLRRTLLLDVTT